MPIWLLNREDEREQASTSGNGLSVEVDTDMAKWTAYLAPGAVVLGLGLLVGGGIVFKSQLKEFIDYFVEVVDTWGPLRSKSTPRFITVSVYLAGNTVTSRMTAVRILVCVGVWV